MVPYKDCKSLGQTYQSISAVEILMIHTTSLRLNIWSLLTKIRRLWLRCQLPGVAQGFQNAATVVSSIPSLLRHARAARHARPLIVSLHICRNGQNNSRNSRTWDNFQRYYIFHQAHRLSRYSASTSTPVPYHFRKIQSHAWVLTDGNKFLFLHRPLPGWAN